MGLDDRAVGGRTRGARDKCVLREREKSTSDDSDHEARLAERQTMQAQTAEPETYELRQRHKCFAPAPEKYDLRQRRKTVFCVSARKARFTSAP